MSLFFRDLKAVATSSNVSEHSLNTKLWQGSGTKFATTFQEVMRSNSAGEVVSCPINQYSSVGHSLDVKR